MDRCSPWLRLRLDRESAFSLVEVVLALGVVSFAIVAILGILPTGLQTGKFAQDETRAAQIAQAILSSIASQAPVQFDNVKVQLNDSANSTTPFHLNAAETVMLYADNDGKLIPTPHEATYAIIVTTNSAPSGFDPGNANQVTVRVMWPPAQQQGPTPGANQTFRDFVRIISKY
ncbi:MAG: hypothetical protein ABI925_07495 [Verrucomicrobiota bacterium]